MSEVEGQITARLGAGMRVSNEQIIKAMEDLAEAARNAGLAARVFSQSRPAPESTEPDRFEYTDEDGDGVLVDTHSYRESWLVLSTTQDPNVYLDQDAVNRLAQYLDQHRTDETPGYADPIGQPREHWCGRSVDHPAHGHSRDGEDMSCLGSYQGIYGASPMPESSQCGICGHAAHGSTMCDVQVAGHVFGAGHRCTCTGRAGDYRR